MKRLFNKYVDIKNIVQNIPQKYGDLLLESDRLIVKFLWKRKVICFHQIHKIRAYSTVDFGLENHFKFLEIYTKEKEVLSFDANQSLHLDFVKDVIKEVFNKTIDLKTDFPPLGADSNGDITDNAI